MRDHLAQGQIALGGAVLQSLRALMLEHNIARLLELLEREHLRRRQPAGEGNDAGLLGILQQLTDYRASHAFGAVGVAILPGCLHSLSLLNGLSHKDADTSPTAKVNRVGACVRQFAIGRGRLHPTLMRRMWPMVTGTRPSSDGCGRCSRDARSP